MRVQNVLARMLCWPQQKCCTESRRIIYINLAFSQYTMYLRSILGIEREHAAFRDEILVFFGTRRAVNCVVRATRG
jgi:hypothetical protein